MVKVVLSLLLFWSVQAQENLNFLEVINQFNKVPNSCNGQLTNLAAEVRQWQELGYTNPRVEEMAVRSPEAKYSHELEMSVILYEDANWSKEEIKSDFAQSAKIFAKCGIRLKVPKFITVTDYQKNIDDLYFFLGVERTIHPSSLPRPVITYGRSSYYGHKAYSLTQSNCQKSPNFLNLCNTAFMGQGSKEGKYEDLWGAESGHMALSHELAHILGDCEHIESDEENILSGDLTKISTNVTDEQCKSFRAHPLVKKL